MAGYTRQSSYTDGDVITAAHSNDEFNQVLAAFVNTTGHKHDGTAAEGPVIGLIGDPGETTPKNKVVVDNPNNQIEISIDVSGTSTEQFVFKDGVIEPTTDNDIDLGSSSKEFKDAFFDGTVTTDALVADTADINGGSVDGATLGTNSAITQAVIDNININGATIGHTDDTDLMTLADGIVTVAGEISVTTLDIGGTNVTSTAAELNILDGVTATASELNIMDGVTATTSELNIMDGVTATTAELNLMDGGTSAGTTAVAGADGIVTNDAGTMRQTTVDTFDTYLAATTKTLTNKTIDADNNTLSNIEVDNLKSGVLDTDLSSVAGTDTTLASAKAIKAYVDAQIQTEDTLEELNDTNISSLASGHILIYDGSDSFDNKAISGDITLASTGAVTIANNAVETAMVNENVVSGQTAITSGDVNITNDTLLLHDADASALKKVTVTNLISSAGGLTEVVADTSPQLGGNLDMNGNDIVTTSNADIDLAPNGTGKVVVKGNDNPGTIVFNCESNSHGQTVKSQPHSASVTNVLTLPAGGDQEIVGAAATQTLTNKTLTSPKINENVAVTATATELNILDGVTATTSELNILDGVTSTASELNILDGVTSTTAELNILDGVTSTASELNILDGVTATTAELNYSDTGSAVGTVVASKVVTVDANKDVSSFRNITLTGELDAGSLDVSGDADIDGTLEADAITVNGTALNTVIANEATALAIALG
jgi:hypothetical protein